MGEELFYKIALTKIPQVGPRLARTLIAYTGSPEAVFSESPAKLIKIPGIGPKIVKSLRSIQTTKSIEKDILYLERHQIKSMFYLDDDFPGRLRHFEDAPVMLYFKGSPNWNFHRTVGVVGTRKPTIHGKNNCKKLIRGLRELDVQIVSGLAYGIDTVVHQEANNHQIENLAIMGSSIDYIYPASNRSLANAIAQNGALCSEFSLGTKPDRENFPLRNRIIAMLSDAIVVVESPEKGGSLITSEYANIYNKDVFAFPGRVQDPKATGCNRLIKSHKAALIEGVDDIRYVMRWDKQNESKTHQMKLFEQLSSNEKKLLDVFPVEYDIAIDDLHARSNVTMSELASLLLNLEFKGLICSLPGKRYILHR